MKYKSATNFDLPSLHILLEEIDVALKDAEAHLSEFYDDEEQTGLLLDSSTVIRQLAAIFNLINFKGSSELALALADCFEKLHDLGDNNHTEFVMDISEGIMVLDRYIEFVLLKEVLEPALLVLIINKLHTHLDRPPVSVQALSLGNTVSIVNPQNHYKALNQLPVDAKTIITDYRTGLYVLLTKKDKHLNADELAKISGLSSAIQTIAKASDALFWQAAYVATHNIQTQLPLSKNKKRTLIYLEQQLQQYLPLEDRRFADLVSLAFMQNPNFAASARTKYHLEESSPEEQHKMKQFLFGPNREMTDTLNFLIQNEIIAIKEKVDSLARGDSNINAVGVEEISTQIKALASTMQLLKLQSAANALYQAAKEVQLWQKPGSDEFDKLLAELMVAENAAIFLSKSHTPGTIKMPLHNQQISLHQLDTAYDTLIKESRANIATVSAAVEAYIADPNKEAMHLQNTPEMLEQVAGSANFLNLQKTAKMLGRLGRYLNAVSVENKRVLPDITLSAIADVLMAADLQFEGQEQNRPINKNSILVGQHSLNRLIA